jgi:hypothetical protein
MNDLLKYDAACNRTSLVLPEDLDKEAWLSVGRSLREISSGFMWWLGDWIRFANEKWGEKYDAAISLGFAYQTALNAVSVAKKFEFSRRRENLSWGHHEAVAYLEEPFADAFLDDAIAHQWSQKELRKQVADFRVKDSKCPIFTLDTPSSPAEVSILPAPGELGAHEKQSSEPPDTSAPSQPSEPIAAGAPESVSEPRMESVPIRSNEPKAGPEITPPPEKPKPAIVSHEAMNISLRADLNRAEATVESLRAQLKEAEQAREQLFEAQKTIYDLKEKIVWLQNQNVDLKRKLEHARMWL